MQHRSSPSRSIINDNATLLCSDVHPTLDYTVHSSLDYHDTIRRSSPLLIQAQSADCRQCYGLVTLCRVVKLLDATFFASQAVTESALTQRWFNGGPPSATLAQH